MVEAKVGCPNGCVDPVALYGDEKISDHFRRSQFECACCGLGSPDPRLVAALERLWTLAEAPIEIVVAIRCERSSAGIRSPSRLAHLSGRGADIRIKGLPLAAMHALAERVPDFRNGGIGLNDDGTLHVDVRIYRSRWARVKGRYLSELEGDDHGK